MIELLPSKISTEVYLKEMDTYERIGLINLTEEMWRLFGQILKECFLHKGLN